MTSLIKNLLLITLIIGTFFGATLGQYPLATPDGARYAEIPREMVVTGDYITPHLNGVKYLEKPPLFYWLQAISIKILGINDLAASIANALIALATVLCIYLTSRILHGPLQGVIASFVFATSALVFALTRIVTLDFALTFFLTASLCTFLLANQLPHGAKRSLYLFGMYIFAACAVMTKGLIGIGLLGIIIFLWLTIFGKWRDLKTYHPISGTFLFLLIALPWHILVQIKNPEFFHFYFIEQHFLRYLTDYAGRSQSWWFLPAVLIGGLYPWIVFLPQAIIHHIPKHFSDWEASKNNIFFVLWIITIYIFYTFSHSKLIPYILPLLPPSAMLIANYLAFHWQNQKNRALSTGFIVLCIINLLFSIGAIIATFTLDFSEQAFTKQNLYFIAMIMAASVVIIQISYRRFGTSIGLIAITLATATTWLYMSPNISIINRQSIKPLITTMQQKLKPEDEVISYGAYYQDLPFYLQKIITVANYAGELDFGMRHQDTKEWMIDQKTFWERWQSGRVIYLITSVDNYRSLQPIAPDRMRIIAKHFDTLLIRNEK